MQNGDVRLSLHSQTPVQLQRIKGASQSFRQESNQVNLGTIRTFAIGTSRVRRARDGGGA